ncbi:sugar ABC transporter substrate-binding protein [Paraburkholderia azotifigens]
MLAGSMSAGVCLAAGRAAWAMTVCVNTPRVVFLNPGEEVERGTGQHWQLVSRFMAATAARFGMQLEVLYAERDHLLMLRQAETVAARNDPPDYVVIVNEKMAAQQMLHALACSPAKVLLIHNDLTDAQRAETGNERGAIANWIGTITADAFQGSFRLMDYLCSQMTLGALAAVRERRANVVVGGLGALPEAVATVMRGDLAAIVAGGQFIGACAMVALYDYHHGVDFAQPDGPRMKLDYLTVLYGDNASRYYKIAFDQSAAPDFSGFSRYRRRAARYDFNLQVLLDPASKAA